MRAALERQEKRQVARRKVLWGARLANIEGSRYFKCLTRDISVTGARIDLQDNPFQDDRAYFVDLRNRFAYEAKVVWKRPPELGLAFIRGYRFDELPLEALRRAIASEY